MLSYSHLLLYLACIGTCLSLNPDGDNVCPRESFNGGQGPVVNKKVLIIECCPDYYQHEGNCKACPPGKYGKNCKEKCVPNQYGIMCASTCSCNVMQSCDPVHGCVCNPGYEGHNCTILTSDSRNFVLFSSLKLTGLIAVVTILAGISFICLLRKRHQDESVTEVEEIKDDKSPKSPDEMSTEQHRRSIREYAVPNISVSNPIMHCNKSQVQSEAAINMGYLPMGGVDNLSVEQHRYQNPYSAIRQLVNHLVSYARQNGANTDSENG